MRILDRKLLRDLRRLRAQFLAVTLVMASGVALFVTLRSMHGYLRGRQAAYYAAQGFADVFVSLRRAPEAIGARVAALPGVEVAETRAVTDVLLDVPGLAEPATGRLVSLPATGPPRLNRPVLRSGAWPDPARRGEVLVSAAFARANGLRVGDSLGAVLHGRWQWLRLAGTAISPEFIYEIRGGAEIFPDNRRFGVLWMPRAALAAALDLTGAFNDLTLTLRPGARAPEVLAALDRLLAPYGGLGAYGRADQLSHSFVAGEVEETEVTSVLLPAICLGVTAFLLHLVLARLVATEREQIGVLKAFGYGALPVARHYLGLALAPVVAGALVGVPLGLWFARELAGVYARFYQFPDVAWQPEWATVVWAVLLAALAALVGALGAVRRSFRLPPAEAMRPEGPPGYRPGPLDRAGLLPRLPLGARTVLRGMERRPGRTLLAVVGLSLALGLCVVSRFAFDAVDHLKVVVFDRIQREDVAVQFTTPAAPAVLRELARLPGVLAVEGARAVPVRVRAGARSRLTGLQQLAPDAALRRVVDAEGRPVAPPFGGLLLGGALASRLAVVPGDLVEVEVLQGRRGRAMLRVSGVVDELLGLTAYASPTDLDRLTGERVLTGAYLRVAADAIPGVHGVLKRRPAIAGVVLRRAAREGFERTIAESFAISIGITVLFACVIAFGVVFNSAQVSLGERARELASLRVLGFTRQEAAAMLLGEQVLLVALAVPLGLLVGYGFCQLIVGRFASELFRLPLVVRGGTIVFAVLVLAGAAVVSLATVRRRVHRLDLVAVLKTRE